MPTPSDILSGLTTIANNGEIIAIIWHLVIALVTIGLIAGLRPSQKLAVFGLSLPLLSVGILAWVYKNPFNGIVFLLFAALLIITAFSLSFDKVQRGPLWSFVIGILVIAFGWFYPHFLESGSWFKYLYAAPTGLIPCPTLSLVTGFALTIKGFSSKLWPIFLVIIGLFYGVFGFFRLGVRLDIVLLIAALILLIRTLIYKPEASSVNI